MEKFGLRELKARTKRLLGRSTGNRRLAAEGRTEEAEAKLLRTQEEILETVAEARREHAARRAH
ncbi:MULTISPECIES: hypothetical protein [Planomonospora]|uniref:hypothetical protein n=1 Tax=Planomonospora TaxID=1998 RepID=UPI00177D2F89|nr:MULTISPECIES: hypothetical protein [Planomonospora]MBG0812942.1 hypothetical protein [Planomonospora sp. ID82291]